MKNLEQEGEQPKPSSTHQAGERRALKARVRTIGVIVSEPDSLCGTLDMV
jgi:hypothetical protein